MEINRLPAQGLAVLPERSVVNPSAPRSVESTRPVSLSGPATQLSEEQTKDSARSGIEPVTPAISGTRLRVDDRTKQIVAEFVDESNQVVRQIPPEELLRISAQFERLQGLLFDEKA